MSDDIKGRLRNWARWVHWCDKPHNGYPPCSPIAHIYRAPSNAGATPVIETEQADKKDAIKCDAAVLSLSADGQRIVRAHYLLPGYSTEKANAMRLSMAWYFRVLQQSHWQMEFYLDAIDNVDRF